MPVDQPKIADHAVVEELDQILKGHSLKDSAQLRAMLKYVVSETLAGRSSGIKAFTIAVDVFGRTQSFDPSTDTIVRVQAGRLRKALEEYYQSEGKGSLLRISLPKGSYVPVFEPTPRNSGGDADVPHPTDEAISTASEGSAVGSTVRIATGLMTGLMSGLMNSLMAASRAVSDNWRKQPYWTVGLMVPALIASAVMVQFVLLDRTTRPDGRAVESTGSERPKVNKIIVASFDALSENPQDKQFARALSAELATLLTWPAVFDVHSMATPPDWCHEPVGIPSSGQAARWALSGAVQRGEGQRRVNVYLSDMTTCEIVWSHAFDQLVESTTPLGMAERIILDLGPQLYSAAKNALDEKGELSPVEAFILANWSPGVEINSYAWQLERIALARRAISSQPDFGPAYSVLADKLSLIATYIPDYDTEAYWLEAAEAAQKASFLAPLSSEVSFNLALYHLHAGDLDEALAFARRTLELAPAHTLARFWVSALPYFCSAAPISAREELRQFDAKLSSSNPVRWQTQLWLARLEFNSGNYRAATEAAKLSMQILPNLGAALILTVALVHEGDPDQARRIFNAQAAYWKGFSVDRYAAVSLPRMCRTSEDMPRLRALHQKAAEALGRS